MSTMQLHDLELLKDIPGYKAILKAVLKSQIQMLVQQLSESTGEETVVLSASIMEGTLYHMGSPCGRDFLDGRDEIKSQFLKHCLQKLSWEKQDAVSSERSPLSSSHTDVQAKVIDNTSYSHSDDASVSSRLVASTDMPPSTSGEPLIIQHSQSHSSDLDTSGMREVSSRKRRKRTNKRQVKPRNDADPNAQESSVKVKCEPDYEVTINNESDSDTNNEDSTCMESTEGDRDWDPASSGFCDAGNQSDVAGLANNLSWNKFPNAATDKNDEHPSSEFDHNDQIEDNHQIYVTNEFDPQDLLNSSAPTVDHSSTHDGSTEQDYRDTMRANCSAWRIKHHRKRLSQGACQVWSCEVCGRDFSIKHNLDRHRRIHMGVFPFQCSTCDKKFSDGSNFVKHLRRFNHQR